MNKYKPEYYKAVANLLNNVISPTSQKMGIKLPADKGFFDAIHTLVLLKMENILTFKQVKEFILSGMERNYSNENNT